MKETLGIVTQEVTNSRQAERLQDHFCRGKIPNPLRLRNRCQLHPPALGALGDTPAGSGCSWHLLPPASEAKSRLRRQDAGLKTHLDQLDQQISELQLDVSRSCEALDSDSRPSSGFYELSDAGSCSLSTSCASVCSDRLSPSLGSWLPVFQPSKSRSGMGDWRPRSADETTVPVWSPQSSGEDSRLVHGEGDAGRPRGMFRPRPVSTGDLERVLPADLGFQRAGTDPASSSLFCQGIEVPAHTVDPKYQRDLVARGGQEVYSYPSPLHAVALQSPLFALPKEAPRLDIHSPPQEPPPVPVDQSRTQTGPIPELGSAEAYIHRLLRLRGQTHPLRDGVQEEQGSDAAPFPQRPGSQRPGSGGQLEKQTCEIDRGGMKPSWGAAKDSFRQQGPVSLVDTEPLGSPLKEETAPWNPCVRGDDAVGSSPCSQAQQSPLDYGHGRVQSPSRVLGPDSPPLAPGSFAYLPCTLAETSPVRVGSPQSKATKARRRVSEKVPRLGKQLPSQPERPRGIHAAPPSEREPLSKLQQGGLGSRPTVAREPPGRSCSESTLYPVPFFVPLLVAQRESYPASSQALFPMEAAPLSSAARRKQRKWQSTMEISAKAHPVSRPGPSLGHPRSPARRAGGPRAQSRPTLARQDACMRSESDPSEHSTECASLFHSTIAETSEDEEASDHTANRFGDESSSNDSEGCVQGSRRGLVIGSSDAGHGERPWPRASLQQSPRAPGGSRPHLPPVPKLCRIKASKALKKKIRRFQPAALKVMTMV
ncbi:dapper homolog 2 isoform X2 [Meriones unguiculatus]|uniref:dapper homolog 2 isoform X2 n=1 Tax=Meriones unguiculatus TaxID=10047 RepID=UPI000B4F469E|nr:dapper homolog 2 isoform X2 [Meriones unguiculatus]